MLSQFATEFSRLKSMVPSARTWRERASSPTAWIDPVRNGTWQATRHAWQNLLAQPADLNCTFPSAPLRRIGRSGATLTATLIREIGERQERRRTRRHGDGQHSSRPPQSLFPVFKMHLPAGFFPIAFAWPPCASVQRRRAQPSNMDSSIPIPSRRVGRVARATMEARFDGLESGKKGGRHDRYLTRGGKTGTSEPLT